MEKKNQNGRLKKLIFQFCRQNMLRPYNSTKIRKTRNEQLNIVCQNFNSQWLWILCQFLDFLGYIYHLFFAIEFSRIIIWWLIFYEKPFQFWQEIWVWVEVILIQLYLKIWDWDWIFGCEVKAISSLGVRILWI